MESESRPPHRRKHSSTTNASSSPLKNPYHDVLLSKDSKAKFEAHEYAEIFSGSSSIPVLDLPALNERVGPGDCRSSKLDYTNIFGGLREDDVAVPYEQLFNGAVKKTKTRIPADIESAFRELGASDQSVDGFKQQFNVSFNKTSQRNNDESNGKTHIAQLHAVPGFTHFVDETPLHNKSSMKREVSQTWSFSSGIEPMTLDKSCNVNRINPKPRTSNRTPPSSHPFGPNDSKDLRQSRLPSFASRMSAGESSPPLLDEELDDDSVAAVSVAALKKAIEQAQESIKIAKMVMEKRKGGLKDGLKPGSKSRLRVKDKKATRIHHSDAPEENTVKEIYRQLDPTAHTFTRNDNFLDAAKDHAVTDVGKKLAPSCSQREILEPDENVEVGNVGPPEAPGETKTFTGLVADAKCKTVTFESGKVDCCIEQMETGKETLEQRELTIHRLIGPEVVVESDLNTCRSVKEMEKSVDEASEHCLGTSDHIGPRSIGDQSERFRDCSGSTQEQEMVIDEGGGNDVTVDKEKSEMRFAGHEEMVHVEQFTVLKYGFDDLQNELGEKDVMEQADMDKKPENVCELKENEQDGKSGGEEENGMVLEEEEHQWFESEVQLTEPVNAVNEPKIVHKNLNHEHGQNETSDVSECEENPDEFDFQEVISGKDIDEAVDAHCSISGTIFSERQEPCDVDLNNFVQDYSMPLEPEMCLAVDENEEQRSIHLELKEMPTTDSLRRCASEETFIESQPNSTFETANEIHNAAQEYASETNMQHLPESGNIDIKATESLDDKNAKPVSGRNSESDEESVLTAFRENTDKVSTNDEREERLNRLIMTPDERKFAGEQSKRVYSEDRSGDLSSQSNSEPKEMEKNKANPSRTSIVGLKDAKGNGQKYDANDHQQRIEAIKKGREREKDRMAVERAIREVRERAFAEARQRAMAEAREKLEKSSVENKNLVDKTSNGAKLRAERAAVERATAEARERALEKAMSQKTNTEARTQSEKYSTERFSSSSRNNGLKHSPSSSDLEKCDGGASESAQRRKARLERHQRIMERAAKALAEKNTRDLLAQKEQAERNRLAESLDADIKRWATGKERNLRALLSTLQYILGPDSGWQPVSLTEIVTTAAVKKAYRKATLCVHPDKLQQRGATIQQKYICEKVFDLLKAAWNRFDSEER